MASHTKRSRLRLRSVWEGYRLPEAAFLGSGITQDAVIRNFEVFGEASRKRLESCPEFVGANPELPLLQAYGMRNQLAHGYFLLFGTTCLAYELSSKARLRRQPLRTILDP